MARHLSLTIYGGVDQIGGNKILLEDGDTRVFFDFGEPFGFKDRFFVDWLCPRESRTGLKDYFHFDLMPRIRGLYGAGWLEDTDLPYTPPEFDAVFLSHIHFDHAMHLRFVDEAIPVYLGSTAEKIRQSWEATRSYSVTFGKHEFRTFRTGSTVKVGSLEVEPIHVDHSVPGAYGFLVHTSEGCVVYSGDLRMHGPRGDMTREFVYRAAEERPVAMICEGTRVSEDDPREQLTEADVRARSQALISRKDKLAVVSFYPKDVDRIRTFREVARDTGRRFVVSTKVAHMLESLRDDPRMEVPDPLSDPNMLVYVRTGLRKPYPHDKAYLDKLGSCDHVVDAKYVSKHQKKLIFHADFTQLTELIDIVPEPGSLFIRSKSEPFEEDEVQEEVFQNWISWFQLDFHQVHASGHASMQEIFDTVNQIGPSCVIPVHTEHPELFTMCSCEVRRPELAKRLSL